MKTIVAAAIVLLLFVTTPSAQTARGPVNVKDIVELELLTHTEVSDKIHKEGKTPVLIIAGDADGVTLEHYVDMFRLLGGGEMGDTGKPLSASRLAILPGTSHTAVISSRA